MNQSKIEIVQIIAPEAIDMERAQEKARELQAKGAKNIRIEMKEVPQPTLAYIHYEMPEAESK